MIKIRLKRFGILFGESLTASNLREPTPLLHAWRYSGSFLKGEA